MGWNAYRRVPPRPQMLYDVVIYPFRDGEIVKAQQAAADKYAHLSLSEALKQIRESRQGNQE